MPVTLANSGVTAGTYGSTSSSNLATNSDPINIPVITVDAKGRITRVINEQHKYTSTIYTADKGIKLTGSTFGLDSSYSGSSTQRYVIGGNLSGKVLHLKTKDFKIDAYGRITSNTTNSDITVDLSSIVEYCIQISANSRTLYFTVISGSTSVYSVGSIVPGSQLWANYDNSGSDTGPALSGHYSGTWISTDDAIAVGTIHIQHHGGGMYSGQTSEHYTVYSQTFKKLVIPT